MAVTVCAAVFVMKSVADDPVSADMSIELIEVVGAIASYQALMLAWVAAFPAASLTFAVNADRPAECVQLSSSHMTIVQVPLPDTVAVSLAPPYVTVTV